jgi:hypothetical protein
MILFAVFAQHQGETILNKGLVGRPKYTVQVWRYVAMHQEEEDRQTDRQAGIQLGFNVRAHHV